MPYPINLTNGTPLLTLADQAIDYSTTSIGLIGRGALRWGETTNENFVALLENSANAVSPANPLDGQLWANTSDDTLNLRFGGTWYPLATEAWVLANSDIGGLVATGDVTGKALYLDETLTLPLTLAPSGVTAGTYSTVTVNAKGIVTAAGPLTLTGDVTGSGSGSIAVAIAASGVTPGTYNSLTVDHRGIVTAASAINLSAEFVKQGGGGVPYSNNNIYLGWSGTFLQASVDGSVIDGGSGGLANVDWVKSNYQPLSNYVYASAGVQTLLAWNGTQLGYYINNVAEGILATQQYVVGVSSFNVNGYHLSPSGVLIQWGSVTTATGNHDYVAFPLTFKNYCAAVVCNESNAQPTWADNPNNAGQTFTVYGVNVAGPQGFYISCQRYAANNNPPVAPGNGCAFNYIAIGY